MRIGKFAEKHGITQDAIRHYLDIGLLVAEKKGGQYKFSEADSKDMDKIIELKQLDFSLVEIQKLLAFQRLSGTNTEAFRSMYLSFLEEKRDVVGKELDKYTRMNDFLKDKIHEINAEELRKKQDLGFPIASLGILACPLCRNSLSMSDGSIENNMVVDAALRCECGYKAIVKNGIYIDETAVRTKLQNGEKMLTKKEYMEISSPAYVNFLYKAMTSMIEYINKYAHEPGYVMELDNCVGFFLLQYIKDLPQNSVYILIDYDLERITILKKDLEMYYEHKNFIFLCCDYHRLPIKAEAVDLIGDYGQVLAYSQATGESLLDKVMPLLKPSGLFISSFPYFGVYSGCAAAVSVGEKNCKSRGKMVELLAASRLEEIEVTDIGPIIEENANNTGAKVREQYRAVYAGRKRPSSRS